MSDYKVLPVEPSLRGPSGEARQVQLDGLAESVTLYHGKADEELDWHIYFRLPASQRQRLGAFLRRRGFSVSDDDVAKPYSELMLVDDRHKRGVTWPPWQASFQWKYDTADLSPVLRLSAAGIEHAAHELARDAAEEPGKSDDLTENSQLCRDRGRIHMQGLLVLDVAHSPEKVEIHPPDSVAFAMDDQGRTLAMIAGEAGWPTRSLRWRVAWFANSSRHRVSEERALQERRTTTWYLDLPGPLPDPFSPATQTLGEMEFTSKAIRLWDSKNQEWYDSRGVASIDEARIEVDPRVNRRRLRVSATMQVPGTHGGLAVREYSLRLRPPVVVTN